MEDLLNLASPECRVAFLVIFKNEENQWSGQKGAYK